MGHVFIGFENGQSVPATGPEPHYHQIFDEKLSPELDEIVQQRVSEGVAEAVWEGVSRFASEILTHDNARLTCTAFCFAAGLYNLEGKSETALARENGVTRAALSKRIVLITERLGLPASRGMKSKRARRTYRMAQLNRNL